MANLNLTNSNIIMQPEDNWSIVDNSTDIWPGNLPFKQGDKFPTEEIKKRASISKTNHLIYDNTPEEIFINILSIFPEIDPLTGYQIREIVANLPYFKNAVNAWVGLVAGDVPLIDTSEDLDVQMSEILESSNIEETLQNEVRSRFLDVISAYRVELDLNEKPVITPIDCKNLIVYVDKELPSSIKVVVVFSIYRTEDGEFIDFIEYHNDGKIVKTTFRYSAGAIGEIVDTIKGEAFGGKFKASPIVVFKHNTVNNQIYGTDQFRYWYPSMLGAMRELQNLFRLGEKTREGQWVVPEEMLTKNPADGSTILFKQGAFSYTGEYKEIIHVTPEVRMEQAVLALGNAVKQVGMDTQLGNSFFDPSSLGSRLSADSLKAAMFPARLEAKRITSELRGPFKDLIVKLGYLGGISLKKSKLTVEFYDGFPKDEKEDIEAVQLRLESPVPSITLVNAIMKLDRVPLRVAKQKALEIIEERRQLEELQLSGPTVDEITEKVTITDSSDIKPTAGKSESKVTGNFVDDTIWENQMIPPPRDIPQGIQKGASTFWRRKRLRQRDL